MGPVVLVVVVVVAPSSSEVVYAMKPTWQWGFLAAFLACGALGLFGWLDPMDLWPARTITISGPAVIAAVSSAWGVRIWLQAAPRCRDAFTMTDDYVEVAGGLGRPRRVRRSDVTSVSTVHGMPFDVTAQVPYGTNLHIPWRWLRLPVKLKTSDEAADYFAQLLGVPRRIPPPPPPRKRWWQRSQGRRRRRS